MYYFSIMKSLFMILVFISGLPLYLETWKNQEFDNLGNKKIWKNLELKNFETKP